MYQTPSSSETGDLSFSEAEDALVAVNESLKEDYDSEDFLVKFEDGVIEIEFGSF